LSWLLQLLQPHTTQVSVRLLPRATAASKHSVAGSLQPAEQLASFDEAGSHSSPGSTTAFPQRA
jgi:hypothetical protein